MAQLHRAAQERDSTFADVFWIVLACILCLPAGVLLVYLRLAKRRLR